MGMIALITSARSTCHEANRGAHGYFGPGTHACSLTLAISVRGSGHIFWEVSTYLSAIQLGLTAHFSYNQRGYPRVLIFRYLHGSTRAALAQAGVLIALIAIIDWRVDLNISFGFLYLFPMLLVGT